ncbi:unnamed protein product [Mytilus edulis]|uniref:Reverse transcriptase domain-containing protein n=1 Tax=Mytilus edulis TaxID=6550 RepID=A0A8S3UH41_MYTED|nr:unnamed protein product [Mytilus edulis]
MFAETEFVKEEVIENPRFKLDYLDFINKIIKRGYAEPVPSDALDRNVGKNGNIDENPTEYRMTVHVFGATSSPSCCNYALQYTAEKFKDGFDTKVTDTVTKNMYVDDCLSSVEKAVSLIKDVTKLCSKGGFNLTKWMTNNETVLESVPEKERSKKTHEWSLSDESGGERALDVYWFVNEDKRGFNINMKHKPQTRLGILSVVSSVYDPIGIASPFVLSAKSILQSLCKRGIGWDEEIPDNELNKLNKWINQLEQLEANRLAVIQDATNIDQWHYVDTKQNPADLASRGTSIDKFRSNDPEIRGVSTVCTVQSESSCGLDSLIERFSDSKRLIKVVALFIRAIDKYKTGPCRHNKLSIESIRNEKSTGKKINMISTEMIVRAEKVLLVYVQRKHFIDEIEVLQKQ